MRLRRMAALFLVVAFMLAGCGTKAEEKEYTFTAGTEGDLERMGGSSHVLAVADQFSGEENAIIQGQLLALFGEPQVSSMDLENAYMYVIIARDQEGGEVLLTAYCGPSGPAIGGFVQEPGAEEAAQALKAYIRGAEPADYEYSGFYFDTASKIVMGVSGGKAYYEETLMTEAEFMEALELCGQ